MCIRDRLKAYLESQGKTVVATGMADYCCMNMGVKTAMKKLTAAGPDAVVCMSCGDGVQVAANHSQVPVYPSNNTMSVSYTHLDVYKRQSWTRGPSRRAASARPAAVTAGPTSAIS